MLTKLYAKKGNTQKAVSVLDRMAEAKVKPNEATMKILMNLCVKTKYVQGAETVVNLML